jgi:hypothetical protein
MVIQSSVLRVILGRDIPFVYPNHECTQLHKPPSSLDGVCHHALVIPPSRMFALIVIGCATNAQWLIMPKLHVW